ncbi:MAG: DsbA family protein [Deltaproteobacteria bacterium]|nr:DsbA family protein [Deltaproteobacteria bacterium]
MEKQNTRFITTVVLAFVVALLTTMGALWLGGGKSAEDSPLTAQQGQAILAELKQVRQAIDDLQAPSEERRPQAPNDEPVSISLLNRPVLGNPRAPLTLVEFTDYQCPFCARFHSQTLPQIKKNYIDTGKLRLVVMDLPLTRIHPMAFKAAQGTLCAAEQGKFFQMSDALFQVSNKLDLQAITAAALKVGLDGKDFSDCINSERHNDRVEESLKLAVSKGFSGTPSFLLGTSGENQVQQAQKLIGAQPYSVFEKAIEAALAVK